MIKVGSNKFLATFSAHQSIDRSLYTKDGQIQGQAQERYVCSSSFSTRRRQKRLEEEEAINWGEKEREREEILMIQKRSHHPVYPSYPPS
jgi:hypothetical protein